jgi:hypothetical protein
VRAKSLALKWDDVSDTGLLFLETNNGKSRRIDMTPAIEAVLAQCPRVSDWVFLNARTRAPYTVNGVAHVFRRALERAGIRTGDVTLHTLRHTALSRMIAYGIDDYTVIAISGQSSTRMLARYTHPTAERRIAALESFSMVDGPKQGRTAVSSEENVGGRREARTRDLRVANEHESSESTELRQNPRRRVARDHGVRWFEIIAGTVGPLRLAGSFQTRFDRGALWRDGVWLRPSAQAADPTRTDGAWT